jgi:hypothetical protein
MKKNICDEISKLLDKQIVPSCLHFQLEETDNINWDKVSYNDYYKSFDFFASKFPNGWQSIPGFDKVIEEMAINAPSPLDEMKERRIESDAIYQAKMLINKNFELLNLKSTSDFS